MGRKGGRRVGRALVAILLVAATGSTQAVAHDHAGRSPRPDSVQSFIDALGQKQRDAFGIPDRYFPFLDDDAKVRTGRELWAEPGPDLNGEGTPEVLETDLRYSYEIARGGQGPLQVAESDIDTRITVRTGSNGKKLWVKRFDTDAYPFPMRVGPKGDFGVVIITGLWGSYGTAGDSFTLAFHAFDARGKELWTREYTSVTYYDLLTWVNENALMIAAPFDGLEGRADDLMLGFATTLGTPLTTTVESHVIVVDGRDGTEHLHPVVDLAVDWWPIPLPTEDLDGDGLEDYATTNNFGADLGEGQEAPSFGGTLYTRRGVDGLPIWTTSGIEMAIWAFTDKLSDVVGDGTPDLGLETYVERTVDLPVPLDVPLAGVRYEPRVYLFEGHAGTERWRKKMEWLYSPGDIDSSGKDDLVLGTYHMSFKKQRTIFEQEAVTGDDHRLWHNASKWHFETMPCPEGLCFGGYGWYLDTSPDIQPDAVDDVVFAQSVQQNAAFDDSISRVFDGRDGKMEFEDEAFLQSVGVAIDGQGTDLISFEPKNNQMLVKALDGHNDTIWSGFLGGPEKLLPRRSFFWAQGFELPGDRCGDLVITGAEDDQSFYGVFDGDSGKILWWRWTGAPEDHPTFTHIEDHNSDC